MRHVAEYPPAKLTGEYRVIFSYSLCCENYLKDIKRNSPHFTIWLKNYARIFSLEYMICSSKLTAFLQLCFQKKKKKMFAPTGKYVRVYFRANWRL